MASTIKVDNVQNQPGTNIISKCSTTITLGASSDTVALASGASQTGFGRTGTVDWVTTPKVTGDSPVTAATGSGYFLNTTAGEITINLPAGAAGSIVSMADYAATWQTNKVTVSPNGSEKIGGLNEDAILRTIGQSITLVYVDGTQGWINTMDSTSNVRGAAPYISASGGNQSPACGLVCGDYKTHIFTGPGTFCVAAGGTPCGSAIIDYFVVAGGGSGGTNTAASGAGAGGFRTSNELALPGPTTSPLANPTGTTVSIQGYPIQVGAGGVSIATPCGADQPNGTPSIFSTITSAGGGGGVNTPNKVGNDGGSGGGSKGGPTPTSGYDGGISSPVTSPVQGQAGGKGYDGLSSNTQGGGGGGAGAAGGNASGGAGAPGGAGSFLADAFIGPTAPTYGTPGPTGSTRYFSGGGGGGTDSPNANAYPGGDGGGGIGGGPSTPVPTRQGTVNTGGGGGAGYTPGGPGCGAQTTGGSGIVMIRYKFQN